jgi:arginase
MNVGIVGAPVDLGAGRRGVDMGPSAIRYAGLAARLRDEGHAIKDYGNVPTPVAETEEGTPSHLKYLVPILGMAEHLADCVDAIVGEDLFPVVLGGDHSISLGSVAGLTRQRTLGIIWLDAHGDFNVPDTSPSGNIHGMVLSALCGYGDERLVSLGGRGRKVDPRNVALIGTRELDVGERALLRSSGAQVFTMHDVDRLGLPRTVELALDRLDQRLDGIHVSLDLDVVDPLQAPGVGTPVLGGLSYRETHLAMELLAASNRVCSLDVVEVNPIFDQQNATARLAVDFTLSALGKRII